MKNTAKFLLWLHTRLLQNESAFSVSHAVEVFNDFVDRNDVLNAEQLHNLQIGQSCCDGIVDAVHAKMKGGELFKGKVNTALLFGAHLSSWIQIELANARRDVSAVVWSCVGIEGDHESIRQSFLILTESDWCSSLNFVPDHFPGGLKTWKITGQTFPLFDREGDDDGVPIKRFFVDFDRVCGESIQAATSKVV